MSGCDTAASPLVQARGLRKTFRRGGGWFGSRPEDQVHAVRGVDLEVLPRETVGLVGESGSGKSTLGQMLIRLIEPDAGTLQFDGADLLALRGRALRRRRRDFQMIFQDPYGSLNPRMRIGAAVGEPLLVHDPGSDRATRRRQVKELLQQVGIDPSRIDAYPHAFSGGQRQRIGIARAIACGPRFVVADEPVSALDPPVQAQIVNLLVDLQERLGLAMLFIAHDLSLVKHVCDRILVMYRGRIVEQAPAEQLYANPLHPYTRALLEAAPRLDTGRRDRPPTVYDGPPPREDEPLVEVAPNHRVLRSVFVDDADASGV